MAEAEDGLDFGGGGGKKDGLGHGAEVGEGVGVVGVEFFGGRDDGAGAGDIAEFGEEGGVHVRRGKGYYGGGSMGSWEQMRFPIVLHRS